MLKLASSSSQKQPASTAAAAAAPIAFQITQNLVPALNNNVCKQQ
jgi:hypothetical protein